MWLTIYAFILTIIENLKIDVIFFTLKATLGFVFALLLLLFQI